LSKFKLSMSTGVARTFDRRGPKMEKFYDFFDDVFCDIMAMTSLK